eukprot:gene653-3961_t
MRYVHNTFNEKVSSTIGATFFNHKINAGRYSIKLQIWDTAGQERFHSMLPMYYRGAAAALLVYDVTNPKSLGAVMDWINELKENTDDGLILCLVANKIDLVESTCDAVTEGRTIAERVGGLFQETSALTGEGISDCFVAIAKELIAQNESQAQTTNATQVVDINIKPQSQRKDCC